MDKWNGQVSVYLTWLDVGLTSRLDRQNKQKQGRLRLPNWACLPPCLQPLLDSWFLDILSSILSRVSKAWLLIEQICCPTTLEHFLAILLLVAKPHCIQLCITWKPRWVMGNMKRCLLIWSTLAFAHVNTQIDKNINGHYLCIRHKIFLWNFNECKNSISDGYSTMVL